MSEEPSAKSEAASFKPPYLPFKTFWSFVGELSAGLSLRRLTALYCGQSPGRTRRYSLQP